MATREFSIFISSDAEVRGKALKESITMREQDTEHGENSWWHDRQLCINTIVAPSLGHEK